MKRGCTLTELAQEIRRQQCAKRDFLAPTDFLDMSVTPTGNGFAPLLHVNDEKFSVKANAHAQIGQHVGIPKPYYDRMLSEAPDLLADNVRRWFHDKPAPRLVRTMDGYARAFLSDRYRPLENIDFLEAALPVLKDENLEIMSCQITEDRLYLKAVDSRIVRDVPTGKRMGDGTHTIFDTCSPAVILSNSETGRGRLVVEYGVYTKACTNLAMIAGRGMRKTHLGARLAGDDDFEARFQDDTRAATDKAIWLQVRDVVRAAFDAAKFEAVTDQLADMSTRRIEGDPVQTVTLLGKRLGVTETEGAAILRHLIEGGDLTQYGLFNAVTRSAQDLESYDRASDFEALGGKVIDLTPADWRELAAA